MTKFLTTLSAMLVFFLVSTAGTLQKQIRSILKDKKAMIGVAVLYNGKVTVSINNDQGYAMLSTFKFPLALVVCDYLDRQKLPLETEIYVSKTDLYPDTYSPLRDKQPEGDFHISIKELLRYCVSLSDNNACDILIRYIGGIEKLQQYITDLGFPDMAIVATETQMHQQTGNQALNRTRPSAAVLLFEQFLQKKLLSATYQDFLEQTLIETTTGANKLKGLLPSGTLVGHKTGSSDRNAAGLKIGDNDMGFVYLPNGKYFVIAVFIMDSMEDDDTNASVIARISRTVYDHYNK